MKVLLSIKPEFANKIFSGEKLFEYRRVIFKRSDIDTIVVYASSPVCKIIGEFKIKGVISDDVNTLWHDTKDHGGISEELFFNYFTDREKGYAIQVGETEEFDDPISIEEYGMNPPQSFAYI